MSLGEQPSAVPLEPISEHQETVQRSHVHDAETPNEVELSRDTIFKLATTGLSFFFAGMNDGSLGSLIPYLIRSYNISTDLVSVVYVDLPPFWRMLTWSDMARLSLAG